MRKTLFSEFVHKCLVVPSDYLDVLCSAIDRGVYVETISARADALHLRVKQNYVESLTADFCRFVRKFIRRLRCGVVDLVCDFTSENFYGQVEGLHVIPWTGEHGVKGRFSYFVAGILFRNKILPLFVTIVRVGCSKAELVGKAVSLCKGMGVHVSKVLLDRGFYCADVIKVLQIERANYLIFVPKNCLFSCMLDGTPKSIIVEHTMKYSKDFSTHRVNTNIALVKDVKDYDWVFASDINVHNVSEYVRVYKRRWNIETMFRVHDEAYIKTKSKNPVVRLFYFLLSMILVFEWNLKHKTKTTYRKYVIILCQQAHDTIFRRAA